MSNCTGVIYGLATSSTDGQPISGVIMDLNWVQDAQGGYLKVGGNDDLTAFVPRTTTTKAREYVIPFFWSSVQVHGSIASALGMLYYSDGSHSGGEFDQTLAIASNFVPNEGVVDVVFKNLPRTGSYSLSYITGDGTELPIFQDTPFSELQDYSPPAQSTPASND